jgi:hypothetical protein
VAIELERVLNLRVRSGNGDASGRKPRPACPDPVARPVEKRSQRQIALGRRPARATGSLRLPGKRRIDGLVVAAAGLENPLDTGDAAKRAEAADFSMLAMTRSRPPQRRQTSMAIQASEATPSEHPLEPFHPRQRPLLVGADASPHSLAWLAAAARVLGTTRARSGLAGANTA